MRIADLFAQTGVTSAPPPHHSVVVSELDDVLLDGAPGARPWLSRLLANCPGGMSRPQHAVELDPTGNIQAGAVWLADGHEAHILAWLPTDADNQAQLRVLNHIACAAAERGAQRVDFPLCGAPYDLPHLRRFSIAAEISDEKPLMAVRPQLA